MAVRNGAVGKTIAAIGAAALLGLAGPASAELPVGSAAPQIAAKGALAGKEFSFNLARALKKGPVVLYFFPKAFTPGCNAEANAFAQSIDDFRKAGAQVVGLSADNLEELKKFSVKECAGKFRVATASAATIRAYDVAFVREGKDTGLSNRTSYVIGRDGKIKLAHSELDWREHVKLTLAKVQQLKAAR